MGIFKPNSSALVLFIHVSLLAVCAALKAENGATIQFVENIPIDKDVNGGDAFKLRYYQSNGDKKDALFLYVGGQQDIDRMELDQVKVVQELSAKFDARFVVLEHRFYGQSLPYGDADATQFTDLTKLENLKLNKVLDDIEAALPTLMKDMKPEATVYLFGTGYSGLLALLYNLRHANTNKAPNGTWISSAPLKEFVEKPESLGKAHESRYDKELTDLFTSGFGCKATAVSSAFTAIDNYAKGDETKKTELLTIVGYSDATLLNDGAASKIEALKSNIVQLIRDIAALNFPFSHPVKMRCQDQKCENRKSKTIPAWPAAKFCEKVKEDGSDDKAKVTNLRDGLRSALGLAIDSTKAEDKESLCLNTDCHIKSMLENRDIGDNELKAKYYQSCTQLIFEKCAGRGGDDFKDFFYKQCEPADAKNDYRFEKCVSTLNALGVTAFTQNQKHLFQPDFIRKNMKVENMDKIRRVIFSSGKYDVYSAANYQDSAPDREVYAYSVSVTAPELDYNPPNTCDHASLKEARTQIGNILQCWVQPEKDDGVKDRCQKKLPTASLTESTRENKDNCKADPDKFPWAQINYGDRPTGPPATVPTDAPTQPTQAPPPQVTTPESDSGIVTLASSVLLLTSLIFSFIIGGFTM